MGLRHILLAFLAVLALSIVPRVSLASYDMENEIGCVHNAGVYYFAASEDYMDEGVNEVAALGTHLVKVELDKYDFLNTWTFANNAKYPWHSSWPTFSNTTTTLKTIATSTYFKNLFSNPNLNYFVMTAYCPNVSGAGDDGTGYWYNSGISPVPNTWLTTNANSEYNQIYSTCQNLLANYSGKTFVFENWEGDGALRDLPTGANVTLNDTKNMAQWMNARCAAVHAAEAAKGASTSNVYCALEANKVVDAINEGGSYTSRTVTDDVLPNTSVDYASYSAYDSMMHTSGSGADSFANCMNWIEIHCPSTVKNGSGGHGTAASVGIGEFGASRWETSIYTTNLAVNNVLPIVINGNTPYCMYWNIYDNDLQNTSEVAPTDTNGNDVSCLGFWMIKPDATPATAWHLWRWQCITNDSVRSSTTNIKAGLTKTYTSNFTTSGLGAGWTTSWNTSYYAMTYNSGNASLKLTNGGTVFPAAYLTLNIAGESSLARGLEPTEYMEYTIYRSATGFLGSQLFGTSTACDDGSGVQPWAVYTGTGTNGWTPISWSWNTEPTWGQPSPTYNFDATNTLGMRLDSADGVFATVSFYLNGTYMGSWLYPTTSTVVNSFAMVTQDGNTGSETFDFGNVSVYQQ